MIALAIGGRAKAMTTAWEREVTLAHMNAALGRVTKFPTLDSLLPKKPSAKRQDWRAMLATAEAWVAAA